MPLMKSERGSPDDGSDEYDTNERQNGQFSCLVCGDVATGRHYGAIACNGCKGFFRRTIRRAYKYNCRFSGGCHIDKHNRAVCRACRYNRCLQAGMKVDAVQNERDLIGKRPRTHSNSFSHPQSANGTVSPPQSVGAASVSPINSVVGSAPNSYYNSLDSQPQQPVMSEPNVIPTTHRPSLVNNTGDPWDHPKLLLDLLMKSEEKIKSLRESVIKETGKFEYTVKHEPPNLNVNGRKATHNDILHSLHSQLLLVIEWAKTLKPFAELCTEDQTALLKNFAAQHIVLCVAYRSINASDFLQLINDTCIPRVNTGVDPEDDFYRKDCERVMDQLVAPMRFMNMNDHEFVALKACVLFNPVARGLSNENVMKVLDTRRRIFSALEHYVRVKNPADTHRIGDLTFFVLSPLQSLAKSISEDVLVTKLSGMARIDLLMDELILEDTEPKAHKNGIDLRRSLSENEQLTRPQDIPVQQPQETLTELRTMQIPPSTTNTTIVQSMPMPVGSAPAQYTLDPNMPTTSSTTELSPIHDHEMMSTLSSYVFGGTLQSPLSPSNDVLFSSAATIPINTDAHGKLSSCSTTLEPISSPQQQWTNVVPTQPSYDYVATAYQSPPIATTNQTIYVAPAPPLNF